MDANRKADKIAAYLTDQFDRVTDGQVLPLLVADRIAKLPGHIQYRIWKMILHLITVWKIDARYDTFDHQFIEIYKWAERIPDE